MQNETVVQPPPPPVPEMPAPPGLIGQPTGSPRAVFDAAQQQREVLGEYMSRLLNRRGDVMDNLRSGQVGPSEREALEAHLKQLNTSIIEMEKQIAQADAQVARAAGIPGSTVRESRNTRDEGPPEAMFIIGAAFGGIAMCIVAVAWARRLWRGATTTVAQIPAAFEARFTRLEQSLDAVAIEVERVSEGQRFLTRVFSTGQNPRAVPAGAAQPVEVARGERTADPLRRP